LTWQDISQHDTYFQTCGNRWTHAAANPQPYFPFWSAPLMQAAPAQPNGNRAQPGESAAISRMQGKVAIAFGMALACVAAVGTLQYQTVRRLSEDNDRVTHNQNVLRELDTVRGRLSRVDAFAQSFAATGEKSDLRSYQQATADLKQQLQELEQLTADNSVQRDKLKALDQGVNDSIRAIRAETDAKRERELSPAKLLPLEGTIRKSRSSVQALSSDVEAEEFRELREWSEQAQAANHQTHLLIWTGCLIAGVLLACAGVGLYVDLRERGKAEASRAVAYEALEQTNERLKTEVRERTEAQRNLQDSERRMRELSLRLLRMQDEEHRRIGRELHDSLGQYLAALKMGLDGTRSALAANLSTLRALEKLAECGELLDMAIREVRTMSYLLHPPLLEECGLRSAIPSYVEGFSRRSGIQVTVEIAPNFRRLGDDAELALFRVLQESLTNVHRHSGSSTAHVRAALRDGVAILEVADQGTGIAGEPPCEIPCKAGVGLQGMTERMRQLGGELRMESSERGTTVRATIPRGFSEQARAAAG
jgi:signal transduction histidine kinase